MCPAAHLPRELFVFVLASRELVQCRTCTWWVPASGRGHSSRGSYPTSSPSGRPAVEPHHQNQQKDQQNQQHHGAQNHQHHGTTSRLMRWPTKVARGHLRKAAGTRTRTTNGGSSTAVCGGNQSRIGSAGRELPRQTKLVISATSHMLLGCTVK